jgi:hypothetical protein
MGRVGDGWIMETNVVTGTDTLLIEVPLEQKRPFPFIAGGVDHMILSAQTSVYVYRDNPDGTGSAIWRVINSPEPDFPWPYSFEAVAWRGHPVIFGIWNPNEEKSPSEPNRVAVHDLETGETWLPLGGKTRSCEDPEVVAQPDGGLRIFCLQDPNIVTTALDAEEPAPAVIP